MSEYKDLNPARRTLLGPGPSNVHPRVLRAMATPLVGHLDPDFLTIMNEAMELLRYVFQTENQLTMAISGTGSAGMETCLVNLLEPGDRAVVGINGLFGERLADIVERCGAELIPVRAEWGKIIEPEEVEEALRQNQGVKLVCAVQAETSTGIRQPLKELAEIAHRYGALLLADTVTSLGGIPVELDKNGVDVAYSGTQKCLSCPPGLSPVSFNEEAVRLLEERESRVQSWYLDLTMLKNYWGKERFYHHTAPISMVYALREALRLVYEEGLEARFRRHHLNGEAFTAGIKALGLELLVAEEQYRLPELIAVKIPDEVNDKAARTALLKEYDIEIGGGLGELAGKLWRVGLMGASSTKKNVLLCLTALEDILSRQGFKLERGRAAAAAEEYYLNKESGEISRDQGRA